MALMREIFCKESRLKTNVLEHSSRQEAKDSSERKDVFRCFHLPQHASIHWKSFKTPLRLIHVKGEDLLKVAAK